MNEAKLLDNISSNVMKFISQFTSESFNLCSIILFHCTSISTLLVLLNSYTDRVPPVDIFIFLFTGLFVMLIKSVALKEYFSVVLNSIGFFIQVILLSLIVFK